MREIRLAFLVHQLITGGAELQMIALAERLVGQGFRVDFVIRSGAGPLDDRARQAGVRLRQIGKSSPATTPSRTRYARRLSKQLRWITTARRERYDIVDAWLHPTDVFAALTRQLTRVPVVMSARLDLLPRNNVGVATPLLDLAVNRLTDVIVANAEICATAALQEPGVDAEKLRVIRGGVQMPPSFTTDERRRQRAALGALDAHFVVGSVGTFRPLKRQSLLVDAFARLLPDHPSLRLVLVGDGDRRPAIERQVRALGLQDRVVIFGFASDLPPLYNAFDLFVQASNSEALPNVLLEASAASLPIVATAAGGTGELIRSGHNGLIVPVEDTDALAAAMRRAIVDKELRVRLGKAARVVVERDYGMDRFVREYVALYRSVLAAKVGEA